MRQRDWGVRSRAWMVYPGMLCRRWVWLVNVENLAVFPGCRGDTPRERFTPDMHTHMHAYADRRLTRCDNKCCERSLAILKQYPTIFSKYGKYSVRPSDLPVERRSAGHYARLPA